MSDDEKRRSLAQLFKPFAQGVLSDVLAKKSTKHPITKSSSSHGSPKEVNRQSTSGAIGKVSPSGTPPLSRAVPSSPTPVVRLERERSNSLPPLPLWEVNRASGSAPDLLGPTVKPRTVSRDDAIAISTTSSSTSSKSNSNQTSPKSIATEPLSTSSDSHTSSAPISTSNSASSTTGGISQNNSRSYTEREKLMHPDAEQAVYRSPRKSDGKMVIVAAPFEHLLSALTDETAHDKDLLEQFLLTHSYFIESAHLLDRLLGKFVQAHAPSSPLQCVPANGSSSSPAETTGSPRMQAIHVQLKLINILKKWIELHVDDFDDPATLTHLNKTLSAMSVASPTAAEWVSHLSAQLNKQKQSRNIYRLPGDTPGRPKPQLPKTKHDDDLMLLEVHPVEFARQLTLHEHEHFQRIPLRDYFRKGWSRLDPSSEVCQLIDQFNRVSFWVASEIVTMPNHKQRTAMISRFIEIGQALQEMGNFNGLMEVISGLNLHVVQRLKLSWKSVSAKHMQIFAQMNDFMDPKCNWQNYRTILTSKSLPLLPFQGLHLTDLTFIEEMPDKMPNGVINFEKMSQLGKIFQEVRRCQGALYNFEPIFEILKLIKEMKPMSEEQLWMSSKMCEPSLENPR